MIHQYSYNFFIHNTCYNQKKLNKLWTIFQRKKHKSTARIEDVLEFNKGTIAVTIMPTIITDNLFVTIYSGYTNALYKSS